jgi:hypothetical protein
MASLKDIKRWIIMLGWLSIDEVLKNTSSLVIEFAIK